jgi:general secretion pathway protein J
VPRGATPGSHLAAKISSYPLSGQRRARTGQGRSRGFTLLEALVGLTVLGLIVVVAFAALRLGTRTWESSLQRAETTDQVRSVLHFLRRQLGAAMPEPRQVQQGVRPSFRGERDRLDFVTPAPRYATNAGLYQMLLALERGQEGAELVLYYAPYDPGAEELPDLERRHRDDEDARRVLLTGLDRPGFYYYGVAHAGESPSWQEQWADDAEGLPQLVDLRLWADGPPLVVQLHSDSLR